MFKTTIDSLVSDIGSKISKLRVLAGEHHNLHLVHTEESVRHAEIAKGQVESRDRAVRIADKFEELLN